MFKKILIISDNLFLCQRFNDIIKSGDFPQQEWVFAVSPFSDAGTFEKELNAAIEVYDLRDAITVQSLVKNYDLIFSIHCKQLFPAALVQAVKCINVHPGYNPTNRGWYPQVFAIIHDLPVGATIHEMDEQLDHGKIIDRALVDIKIYDTSETLYNKIIQKERELLQKNLVNIIHNKFVAVEPESGGNVFLKKDFKALLHFDLNKKMTGLECINQLRALTHGDHNNAYFLDPETGKKVFIKISLQPDESR